MCLFGMSPTLYFAIIFRLCNGLMSGNIGVAKSYLGEITDESNQAEAFSYQGTELRETGHMILILHVLFLVL